MAVLIGTPVRERILRSVNTLIAIRPADAPVPPILPPRDGFLFPDLGKFHASFAADLSAAQAAFMGTRRSRGASPPSGAPSRTRLAH